MAKNIYRDVLTDLIPTLRLETGTSSPKKARYDYYVGRRTESEQSGTSFIDTNDIASLLDYCRVLKLTDEKDAIIDQLVESSKTVDPSGFGAVFIPLFARLVELSRFHEISLDESISKTCFQDVMTLYVQRYIGLEPAKPRDWAQARTGCGCGDCQALSRFLTDPVQKVGRFAMAEKRRRHLEYKLPNTGCDLDTERYGSPHTLVVTKTLKKWHESLKEWKARCKLASQSFHSIGIEAMEQIFGERYEEFASFEAVKLGIVAPASAEPESLTASNGQTPTTTANVARPVPPQSARAPHTAKSTQAIPRKAMSTLSQSISRIANVQEVARLESKREAKKALLKYNGESRAPQVDIALEQRSDSTPATTECIDLTSD